MVAVGAWLVLDTWRQNQQAAGSQEQQAKVFRVGGDDGRPVYVVVQGDQASVVDPNAVDGKAVPAEREPARAVKTRPRKPLYFPVEDAPGSSGAGVVVPAPAPPVAPPVVPK